MTDPDPPYPVDGPAEDRGAAHRRTVLFTAIGAVLAAALLFAVVARVVSTRPATSGGGRDAEGNRVAQFELGRATDYARTIARDGPILFPDPQGQTRDIYVQHLGESNWLAFEARVAGAPRQCVLTWEREARHFVDPCDGRMYPPDGTGLVTFPTRVNDKGRVIVDLGSPTTPQAP